MRTTALHHCLFEIKFQRKLKPVILSSHIWPISNLQWVTNSGEGRLLIPWGFRSWSHTPFSYISAPEAALRARWGRPVLWVPARAVHRPPNPPVLLALWVWAGFGQHRRHPGCSALHGQVGRWALTSPQSHPTALHPVEGRRERWPDRLRLRSHSSLTLKTEGSCLLVRAVVLRIEEKSILKNRALFRLPQGKGAYYRETHILEPLSLLESNWCFFSLVH